MSELPSQYLPPERLEQLNTQNEAKTVVQNIARTAGNALPISRVESETAIPSEPGIYLLNPRAEGTSEVNEAHFEFNERMLSGAINSAHAVIAGTLEVGSKDGQVRHLDVAAKCSIKRSPEERFARAKREIEVMRLMQQHGKLGLNPVSLAVGLPRGEEGSPVVLLTEYDESVYTLDNAPWGRGATPQNVGTAAHAAQALGEFNASIGFMHGDAKIKNVATTTDSDEFAMIDFETSKPIDMADPMDASAAVHEDLGKLLESLNERGLFQVRTSSDFQNNSPEVLEAVRFICEAYLLSWVNAPDDVQEAVFTAVGDVAQTLVDKSIPYVTSA